MGEDPEDDEHHKDRPQEDQDRASKLPGGTKVQASQDATEAQGEEGPQKLRLWNSTKAKGLNSEEEEEGPA